MSETQFKKVSEETYKAASKWINKCIAEGFMPGTKEVCDKYQITPSQVNAIAQRMEFAQ